MTKLKDLGMTASIGCSAKFDVQLYLVAVAVRCFIITFHTLSDKFSYKTRKSNLSATTLGYTKKLKRKLIDTTYSRTLRKVTFPVFVL